MDRARHGKRVPHAGRCFKTLPSRCQSPATATTIAHRSSGSDGSRRSNANVRFQRVCGRRAQSECSQDETDQEWWGRPLCLPGRAGRDACATRSKDLEVSPCLGKGRIQRKPLRPVPICTRGGDCCRCQWPLSETDGACAARRYRAQARRRLGNDRARCGFGGFEVDTVRLTSGSPTTRRSRPSGPHQS